MTEVAPLAEQVDGTHYKNMKVQPIEFAMVRGYDAATFSVLKYISRHRRKNGLIDLEKASHFVRLCGAVAEKFAVCWNNTLRDVLSVEDYCASNGLHEDDAEALRINDELADIPAGSSRAQTHVDALLEQIARIGERAYGGAL